MGLRGYIRERLIAAVQYAVREEMNRTVPPQLPGTADGLDEEAAAALEERIVQRLDKQIERWTWERYQRTEKNVQSWSWDSTDKIYSYLDSMKVQINMDIDKRLKNAIGGNGNNLAKKQNLYDETKKIEKIIERWTWERYKRSEDKLLHTYALWNYIADIQFNQNKVRYHAGEKIRVVFLYQVASFWPSWEHLYQLMIKDDRFEVKLVLLEETAREEFQMITAREFLEQNNIEYSLFEEFDLEKFQPHIVFIQTPYDAGHRQKEHWSASFKSHGYRVIYIPYGVEISDTLDSHSMHFRQHVVVNSWRVYTFSNLMKRDYWKYSYNRGAVRALGLPRFDSLYLKDNFELSEELRERIHGRKVVLWKVHFPKIIEENGENIFVTPDINDYIRFAEKISEYEDYFFIFMPHPRFKAPTKDKKLQDLACRLVDSLEALDNVYIDTADDYRNSLMNADYIIVDRSAVMVEAAAVQVPILFMYNPDYFEPVTDAIKELIDSYYQGSNFDDMVNFMEMIRAEEDPKREEREAAFRKCIPYFDGRCAERIMDDIESGLNEEITPDSYDSAKLQEYIEAVVEKKLKEKM